MKLSLRYFFSSSGAQVERSTAHHHELPPVIGDFPAPGDVLLEIGLLLAIHLAVALAIGLTLRAFGIA